MPNESSTDTDEELSLPQSLVWLADAPMFIDAPRLEAFHDAIVQPEGKEDETEIYFSEKSFSKIAGGVSGGVSAQIDSDDIPDWFKTALQTILPSMKLNFKGEAKAEGKKEEENERHHTMKIKTIHTPQRQLTHLALFYLAQHPDRVEFVSVDKLVEEGWRSQSTIREVPRQLVFLDLPAFDEAEDNIPKTMLIPTAAEFENGVIEQLFGNLKSKDGCPPPSYPEEYEIRESFTEDKENAEECVKSEIREKRREYWKWFQEEFRPLKAMEVVEKAASKNGRIQWIDYRVPITKDGDTLHLHICPKSKYDTGTFAYNLIKRGYKHGMRIIGTLKSEPDMNVLSIYEK